MNKKRLTAEQTITEAKRISNTIYLSEEVAQEEVNELIEEAAEGFVIEGIHFRQLDVQDSMYYRYLPVFAWRFEDESLLDSDQVFEEAERIKSTVYSSPARIDKEIHHLSKRSKEKFHVSNFHLEDLTIDGRSSTAFRAEFDIEIVEPIRIELVKTDNYPSPVQTVLNAYYGVCPYILVALSKDCPFETPNVPAMGTKEETLPEYSRKYADRERRYHIYSVFSKMKDGKRRFWAEDYTPENLLDSKVQTLICAENEFIEKPEADDFVNGFLNDYMEWLDGNSWELKMYKGEYLFFIVSGFYGSQKKVVEEMKEYFRVSSKKFAIDCLELLESGEYTVRNLHKIG